MGARMKWFLKLLAVVVASVPFVLAGLVLFSGTTSLAVVAPGGMWLLATIFVVPLLLGVVLWRLSAKVH
jgi:hypothetical protein